MSERPWCVEHDREAGFVTTDQKRVCWVGLSAGGLAPECRIVTATVTIGSGTERFAQIAALLKESIHEDVDGGLDRFVKALEIAKDEASRGRSAPSEATT